MRVEVKSVRDSRLDHHIVMLDQDRELVAVSTQVVQVIPTQVKHRKSPQSCYYRPGKHPQDDTEMTKALCRPLPTVVSIVDELRGHQAALAAERADRMASAHSPRLSMTLVRRLRPAVKKRLSIPRL